MATTRLRSVHESSWIFAFSIIVLAGPHARAQQKGDDSKAKPADTPATDERLNGTWTVTRCLYGPLGEVSKETLKSEDQKWVFENGKAAPWRNGAVWGGPMTSRTDATKAPATIDMTIASGRAAGGQFLGIYEVAGDTLKLRYTNARRGARPAKIDGGDGMSMYFEMERVKPER